MVITASEISEIRAQLSVTSSEWCRASAPLVDLRNTFILYLFTIISASRVESHPHASFTELSSFQLFADKMVTIRDGQCFEMSRLTDNTYTYKKQVVYSHSLIVSLSKALINADNRTKQIEKQYSRGFLINDVIQCKVMKETLVCPNDYYYFFHCSIELKYCALGSAMLSHSHVISHRTT